MLTISPVKPREPVLSEETRRKLMAAQLGIEHERRVSLFGPVCAFLIAAGLIFLVLAW